MNVFKKQNDKMTPNQQGEQPHKKTADQPPKELDKKEAGAKPNSENDSCDTPEKGSCK